MAAGGQSPIMNCLHQTNTEATSHDHFRRPKDRGKVGTTSRLHFVPSPRSSGSDTHTRHIPQAVLASSAANILKSAYFPPTVLTRFLKPSYQLSTAAMLRN